MSYLYLDTLLKIVQGGTTTPKQIYLFIVSYIFFIYTDGAVGLQYTIKKPGW